MDVAYWTTAPGGPMNREPALYSVSFLNSDKCLLFIHLFQIHSCPLTHGTIFTSPAPSWMNEFIINSLI